MPLAANETREQFLAYFERKSHRRLRSDSLVPDSDPTFMFVNGRVMGVGNAGRMVHRVFCRWRR